MSAPNESDQKKLLSTCLSLLTTLNEGILDLLGPGSKGLIFNAGLQEGKFIGKTIPKNDSIEEVIEAINETYQGVWNLELFKEKGQDDYYFTDDKGQQAVKIVLRQCPIRQAVLTHDLNQAGPICYLTNGYLCGIVSEIMDKKAGLDIEHNGPNACLKKLYFRE